MRGRFPVASVHEHRSLTIVFFDDRRRLFQWLDAFEMTITVAPTRTLRDDGRHFFSNVGLQVLNAALNLVCPLPGAGASSSSSFVPFAHTTCTQRRLPEVPNERITRKFIESYLQSEWDLIEDTRTKEEACFHLVELFVTRNGPTVPHVKCLCTFFCCGRLRRKSMGQMW